MWILASSCTIYRVLGLFAFDFLQKLKGDLELNLLLDLEQCSFSAQKQVVPDTSGQQELPLPLG